MALQPTPRSSGKTRKVMRMGRIRRKSRTYNGGPWNFLAKPRKGKESKRGSDREWKAGGGPPAPPGAPGALTYLLAAAAARVGLGVRRRAAAAPGRGVKVPGIILVHDPRWGPERKQGVFLSPPSPRPRTGCCALALCGPRLGSSLCSRLVPHGGGRDNTREQCPLSAERCTSFLPY